MIAVTSLHITWCPCEGAQGTGVKQGFRAFLAEMREAGAPRISFCSVTRLQALARIPCVPSLPFSNSRPRRGQTGEWKIATHTETGRAGGVGGGGLATARRDLSAPSSVRASALLSHRVKFCMYKSQIVPDHNSKVFLASLTNLQPPCWVSKYVNSQNHDV